jgi:hypothetical protein
MLIMKKQTIILFLVLGLVFLLGVALIIFRNNVQQPPEEIGQQPPPAQEHIQVGEILGQDDPDVDAVSVRDEGGVRTVTNETNTYSVSFPITWSAETQRNAMRFFPEGAQGESACFITSYVFDQPDIPFEEETYQLYIGEERGPLVRVTIEGMDNIGTGNYSGFLMTEFYDDKINEETVLIQKNNKVYAFSSAYDKVKGQLEKAHYSICRPVFENFLRTITIY